MTLNFFTRNQYNILRIRNIQRQADANIYNNMATFTGVFRAQPLNSCFSSNSNFATGVAVLDFDSWDI